MLMDRSVRGAGVPTNEMMRERTMQLLAGEQTALAACRCCLVIVSLIWRLAARPFKLELLFLDVAVRVERRARLLTFFFRFLSAPAERRGSLNCSPPMSPSSSSLGSTSPRRDSYPSPRPHDFPVATVAETSCSSGGKNNAVSELLSQLFSRSTGAPVERTDRNGLSLTRLSILPVCVCCSRQHHYLPEHRSCNQHLPSSSCTAHNPHCRSSGNRRFVDARHCHFARSRQPAVGFSDLPVSTNSTL